MSNIPYFEQLTDGEALNPKKAAALAFQVKSLSNSYVALLTHEEGAAAGTPVTVEVLENNTGKTITWAKLGTKTWRATTPGGFDPYKTTIGNAIANRYIFLNSGTQTVGFYWYFVNLNGEIELYTYSISGFTIASFDLLYRTPIEIKIYP